MLEVQEDLRADCQPRSRSKRRNAYEMNHEYFYKYWVTSKAKEMADKAVPPQGSHGCPAEELMWPEYGIPRQLANQEKKEKEATKDVLDCAIAQPVTIGIGRGRGRGHWNRLPFQSLPSQTPCTQMPNFGLQFPQTASASEKASSSSGHPQTAANHGQPLPSKVSNERSVTQILEEEEEHDPDKIRVVIGRSSLLDTFLPLEPLEKDLEEVRVTFSYPTAEEVRQRRRQNPGPIKQDDDLREASFLMDLRKYREKKKARRGRLQAYVAKNSNK